MESLVLFAPILGIVAVLAIAFAVYSVMCAVGRPPEVGPIKSDEVFGPYIARYTLWVLSPVERGLRALNISPNSITWGSVAACAGAGIAISQGHLATGAWLYGLGGVLDILDGRLARATGRQTPAGALFDSVADRWAELFLFTGFAWHLRETPWLLAVMSAIAGSLMVSYTRARGEGLGIELKVGAMQRAERIVLVVAGTLVAAWLTRTGDHAHHAPMAAGVALAMCGALSSWTALGRWHEGYRKLVARQAATVGAVPTAAPAPIAVPVAVPVTRRKTGDALPITREHSV